MKKEIPTYSCSKQVKAFEIRAVFAIPGSTQTQLIPEDQSLTAVIVDPSYIAKHNPVSGGYYVLYQDGYQSFSPAKPFEEGYRLA
jgi:hypothetical protein